MTRPPRNPHARDLAERRGRGSGKHHTRERDLAKGRRRKPKHRRDLLDESEPRTDGAGSDAGEPR